MQRIGLSNATFEGDNNAYLFDDGPETVLVDTGDWLAETRIQLEDALDSRDISFADVDRIFLTHWHGDHSGLASTIQEAGDATVYVHSADAPLVAGEAGAWQRLRELHAQYFEQWGLPAEKRSALLDRLHLDSYLENPPDVTPIEDGETFAINDRELTAVHAPGHTAGLCLYETTADGEPEALVGDALLSQYTPNVGGADVRLERPLAQYLETLDAIAEAGYSRAWPGHREPIDDPTARAEAIVCHHEERAWRVLDALRRLGPSDAWTVSADLFGELEGIHILHGPGEAYAHLEHLDEEGMLVRHGDEYRLAAGVEDELDTHANRWPLD